MLIFPDKHRFPTNTASRQTPQTIDPFTAYTAFCVAVRADSRGALHLHKVISEWMLVFR